MTMNVCTSVPATHTQTLAREFVRSARQDVPLVTAQPSAILVKRDSTMRLRLMSVNSAQLIVYNAFQQLIVSSVIKTTFSSRSNARKLASRMNFRILLLFCTHSAPHVLSHAKRAQKRVV